MSAEISPQLEDGHTRIANEILDAIISFDFSKRQHKVVLQVIRKTYGFNKKVDDMTVSQIARSCGLQRTHVSSTISELVAMNVLLKSEGKYGYVLGLNKNLTNWLPYQNGTCTKTVQKAYRNSTLTVPKQYTQKTLSKDNTKEMCFEVLNYLNKKVGRNYKPVTANIDLIKSRLKEGFVKDDLIHVIDVKTLEWLKTDMNKFLRPATLFNASKFSQYVAERLPQIKLKQVTL